MPYANISDLKQGSKVILDGGFTCVEAGPAEIQADEEGELYFCCSMGRHYIEGQLEDDGTLVGISHSSK